MPGNKLPPISGKPIAIVSHDPRENIKEDSEYSSIRSTPAPGKNQFKFVNKDLPRIAIVSEDIDMRTVERLNSQQQSKPGGDYIVTDSSGNVSNVDFNHIRNQPVEKPINVSEE